MSERTIGFVGGGNMAEAMIRGLLRGKVFAPENVIVSGPRDERMRELSGTYGIRGTLDNREAQILVGDKVPIRIIDVSSQAGATNAVPRATVRFEQTGINLKVTPHVTNNRQILMEVHAERSNVRPASVDIGFTFQTQQADNQILVNDGETAVIGGLTVTEVTVTKSGIPFLVDLPILGKLFGFTSQTENRRDLLILITPHIIDDLAAPGGQ